MTPPADIPQWAWDEAIKLNVGDDLTPAERATAEEVYFADLDRDARALLAAYERGRGEPNIDKGKIIETVCPQGVDEWSVSLVLDAIRKAST